MLNLIKNHRRNMIFLLSIIMIELLVILIFTPVFINEWLFDLFSNLFSDSTEFNNIVTPVVTIVAVIVYYKTLRQVKKQSESMKDDMKITKGDYFINQYSRYINDLKDSFENQNIADYCNRGFNRNRDFDINVSFIEMNKFTNKAHREISSFINDEDYLRVINEDRIDFSELEKLKFFKHYDEIRMAYVVVSQNLLRITRLIKRVEFNEMIHSEIKKIIHEDIIRKLLRGYVLYFNTLHDSDFIMIKEAAVDTDLKSNIDFKIFNFVRYGEDGFGKSVEEYYKLKVLFDWVTQEYPYVYHEIVGYNTIDIYNDLKSQEVKEYSQQ